MTADPEFKLVALKGSAVPVDTRGRALHDLRISVMDRCNFRCPYCMPRETFHENYRFLKSSERLSFEEIVRLTRLFVSLGVRKVRLTGGEPLLRANLPDLVGELTSLAGVEDVALTTNGMLLAKYAAELKANGLQRVAWFDSKTPLRSGWAWGQEHLAGGVAVVEAKVGQGKLVLFGPEILFRAQPHGTFKFLFNGIAQAGTSKRESGEAKVTD